MRVIFTDGSTRIVQTSPKWRVAGKKTRTLAAYGEQPFGRSAAYALSPVPATWYRRGFTPTKAVSSARLYLCGLGCHEFYLNGQQVGDHVMDPAQTDYDKIAHYVAHDVTSHLQQGDNTLAVLLGDGWFNQDRGWFHANWRYGIPVLRALLTLHYNDGTSEHIISDGTWHWKPSPIVMNNVYLGEIVDLRRKHRNRAADTPHARLYRRFKNSLRLPLHYLNQAYQTRLVRHFYSPQEIAQFKKKWTKSG